MLVIDIEALLQSVTTDGEDVSIDIQELAELGDFSDLGRLDFNDREEDEVTRDSNQGGERVGRQPEEEEEEFDGMGWEENPPDCGMWNVVGELEDKGGVLGAGLSNEVGHDEEYWEDEEGEDVELEVGHGIVEAGMGRGVWNDGVAKQDAFEDDLEREESAGEMDRDPIYGEDTDGDYVEDTDGDGSGINSEKKSATEQDLEDEEGGMMEEGERGKEIGEEVEGEKEGKEESYFDEDEGGTIGDRWQGIEKDEEDDEEQEIVDGEYFSRGDYDEYMLEGKEDDEEYSREDNENGEREDDREERKKKDDDKDMVEEILEKEFDDARRVRELADSGESGGDWTTDDSLVEGTSVNDISSYDEDDEDLGDQSTDYNEEETDVETETEQYVSFELSKGNTGSDSETPESEADDQSEERSYNNPSTNVKKSPEIDVSDFDAESETPERSSLNEASQTSKEGSFDDASEETRVGMEEWLDFQRQNPVPSDVPTRKTLDQLHEDGLTEVRGFLFRGPEVLYYPPHPKFSLYSC